MFVISNILLAVSHTLDIALEIYKWIVIVSALLSFVNPDPYNPVVKFLRSATEPVYRIIRKYIPTIVYNVDFAPFIVILFIIFLQRFLVPTLQQLAYQIQ
ncbi:YggT family protein [Sulfurihydrogenibium sp.]|uniref:YggT family protein n=1 Tax=Sulfurihydrogenibium sp. TaxID=2053621 RepID=UPI002634DAC8|nr:YggT family protein [Sulfurihydrogenibium sp.]